MDALKRLELLEKIAALAGEYCVAVDLEADDIGGAARSSLTVLQEIGPLTHKLEGLTAVTVDVQRDTISCEVDTLTLYVRGEARGDLLFTFANFRAPTPAPGDIIHWDRRAFEVKSVAHDFSKFRVVLYVVEFPSVRVEL